MTDIEFKLNTGASIPALGLGTWQSGPGEVAKAVSHALSAGYRHIDCAYIYSNEDEVGQGLAEGFKSAQVKREDVFVTTKLWCTYHTRVEENLDQSLKSLGLDYVDLYLMHWPCPMNSKGNDPKFPKLPDGSRDLDKSWSHIQTYKEMEKLLKTGKAKAIGVCNYSLRYLEELLPQISVIPAVNQIENHPSLPQQEIVDYCKAKGVHITAYSPLGSFGSPLFKAEPVLEVAKKRSVSASTVLLSYHIARGSSVLAKSVTPSRIDDNRNLINLDAEDMKILNQYSQELAAKGELKRYVYPSFGVDFGFPDKS
ncbi:H/ACA snoRNP pseudouridylase subunit [Toensbergia leucococca]|nr:H/ACA snoRNP pseudouridylase subunit [Toensbergia leucococca]